MTGSPLPQQLPVRLQPHPDELLSSWIRRHAVFYAVPPLVMLRHCIPDASSLRAADLHLNDEQVGLLASRFAAETAVIQRMTFSTVPPSLHRFIAAKPVQCCMRCGLHHTEPALARRSQLLAWRITCPLCGDQLRDANERELPALLLVEAKGYLTMKSNAASGPGHHRPKLHGFY